MGADVWFWRWFFLQYTIFSKIKYKIPLSVSKAICIAVIANFSDWVFGDI